MGPKPSSNSQGSESMISDGILARLYFNQENSADMLPYTDEMAQIVKNYNELTKEKREESELWKRLIYLRKAGKLKRKD